MKTCRLRGNGASALTCPVSLHLSRDGDIRRPYSEGRLLEHVSRSASLSKLLPKRKRRLRGRRLASTWRKVSHLPRLRLPTSRIYWWRNLSPNNLQGEIYWTRNRPRLSSPHPLLSTKSEKSLRSILRRWKGQHLDNQIMKPTHSYLSSRWTRTATTVRILTRHQMASSASRSKIKPAIEISRENSKSCWSVVQWRSHR